MIAAFSRSTFHVVPIGVQHIETNRKDSPTSMPTDSSEGQSSYFIDAENAAEMARLIDQDHIITKGMGGLFAAIPDLSRISRALDLGCGPGEWALEVAF